MYTFVFRHFFRSFDIVSQGFNFRFAQVSRKHELSRDEQTHARDIVQGSTFCKKEKETRSRDNAEDSRFTG